MTYIPKINGVAIAAPLPFEQGINPLDMDSGRVASGTMVRNFIGNKRQLSFEWKFVTIAEGRAILDLVHGASCTVTYEDDQEGVVTKKFYVGPSNSKKTACGDFFEYVKFNVTEM